MFYTKCNPNISKLLVKCIYYVILSVILFSAFYIVNTNYIRNYKIKIGFVKEIIEINSSTEINPDPKYILLWTSDQVTPFVYFGKGESVFMKKKCEWINCVVTSDRNALGYYTEFDVIAFHGPQLLSLQILHDIPTRRSPHQKYVFANIEAAANYPIQTKFWNRFFNWTWTYKVDSDGMWGYVAVRNATNYLIGPSKDMHWISASEMIPTNSMLKEELKSKTKAAAWFASNCNTLSLREEFVKRIQKELKIYNLTVDVYGACGDHICPREMMSRCLKLLKKHYYFFFAFENAFSEDYVTEKIVYALKSNTVPVVYGGANYSRFMPDGSYLNARLLGPARLAKKIYDLIQNREAYYDFFRWTKYYSFSFRDESPDTDDYCRFCAMLNDESLLKTNTVYDRIDLWWNTNQSTELL